ncbi:hypothetical protein KRX57_09675 [Weeksellaceae bacterium TAE3-ERU29]|nr:hypothetical protein [Weeksellaceae bacterium TAE3-ERU29]
MKKLYSIIFILVFSLGFSQIENSTQAEYKKITPYFLFNVGYNYQNISYLNTGLDLYIVAPSNNIIDLGASADIGFPNGDFTVIPKAQLGYLFNVKNSTTDPYSNNFSSAFWLVRTNVTPWSVQPEAGITILSLLEFTAGYGFNFRENPKVNTEGLKVGFNLKLPFLLFWHE